MDREKLLPTMVIDFDRDHLYKKKKKVISDTQISLTKKKIHLDNHRQAGDFQEKLREVRCINNHHLGKLSMTS
jgi:hypothetical protein